MGKKGRLGTVVLIVAIIALHSWSLMRYPAPYVDEGWLASRAWAFIHTGRPFGPLDADVFERFEGYWVVFPWLPTMIQSLALRLSGTPALFPLRMMSLGFGLLLLAVIYAIANRLGGRRLALLSVSLVSLSVPFLYSAHLARCDILVAVLGFGSIALFLNDRLSRWWAGLLSGLCVGLAFEIHPQGAIYGPALVALYFLRWRWAMFRKLYFWCFFAGVVTGLVFYVAIHVLRYPQTYVALNRLTFGPTHVPPLLTLDSSVVVQAIGDMGKLLIVLYTGLIPLIAWASIALVRRRSQADKTLLVLNAVLVAELILLARIKILGYMILVTPAIDMLIAAFLLRLLQRPWRGSFGDYVRHGLGWGLCVGAILWNLSPLRIDFEQVQEAVQRRVNQAIGPDDSIMASQLYWFDLHDHVYYSWEELVYYRRYAPGSSLEEALTEFRPDILIIDIYLDVVLDNPDRAGNIYLENFRLPRAEMEAFLDCHADLVTAFDGGYYGQIRVYRINWEG
jgi:4-amino-4-deoxy-L-arabinose transferase-like glycosyltransferase